MGKKVDKNIIFFWRTRMSALHILSDDGYAARSTACFPATGN